MLKLIAGILTMCGLAVTFLLLAGIIPDTLTENKLNTLLWNAVAVLLWFSRKE